MRRIIVAFCILAAVGLAVGACSKPRYIQIETRPALAQYDNSRKAYVKKAVLAHVDIGRHGMDPGLQERHFNTVAQTLGRQPFQIAFILPGDDGYPDFAARWAAGNPAGDVSETARLARTNGFNALVSTSLADIRVHSKKSGFWFWRSTKYQLTIAATLEILDPFTAAKSFSLVEEKTVKIEKATYDAIRAGQWDALGDIDETIQQLSQTMTKKAAKKLERIRWQAAVISVDADRLTLAVGKSQGLALGDRLAVFEGREVLTGNQGQTFIAPGYLVGEVRVSDLDRDRAEAVILDGADIQVGDIAVAANQ